MSTYIKQKVRECLDCQKCKILRHEKSQLQHFQPPDDRFAWVHLDIVGPLPQSDGKSYILTCLDRFTRWPEAIPLSDQTAESIGKAFWEHWITRFGAPVKITTDQGRSFESRLFKTLACLSGAEIVRAAAYHPQTNGILERWHRTLKQALMARLRGSARWTEELPSVLMGLRSSFKPDIGCSPAELVFGCTTRLPGDFFASKNVQCTTSTDYAERLSSTMANLRFRDTAWHVKPTFFHHRELDRCSHVFLRDDTVKKPLIPPYNGPYRVLAKTAKTFRLVIKGKEVTVSRDRVKPAHLQPEDEKLFPLQEEAPRICHKSRVFRPSTKEHRLSH